MGVPGFFAWLRRKYPQIVDDSAGAARDGEGNACDNLYVDMNHIIHGCSHPKWRDDAYASELEIFQGIQQYLERLIRTCRPERLLMIAIDGVAPQAKMCQQRTRRFMSAHTEYLRKGIEKEVRREMLAQARNGIIIPALTSFDGNVITPGTPFMARLAAHLRRFLAYKVGSDSDWRHIQVVLSDSNEPGEGEHKIMRFIRHQRACPEYDPNTRHVIYGQDADLILLALLTHEPHFSLLREAGSLEEAVKELGLDPVEWSAAKHQPLQFLNVSTLREYLRFDFFDLVGEALEPPPASDIAASDPWHQEEDLPEPAPEDDDKSSGPKSDADDPKLEGSDDDNDEDADVASSHAVSNGAEDSNHPNSISAEASMSNARQLAFPGGVNSDGQFDFERVLQDFVLLTFLSGNDFLPSIPSLEIYAQPSGLDVLLKTYKEQLPALGGPITNGSVINMDRLKRMLTKLAEDEENAFKRQSLRRARDFQRLAEQENERQAGNGAGARYSGPDGSGQWVSMGELGSNDLDQVLGGLGGEDAIQSQVLDLLTATPEELIRELCQRVTKRLEERLKGTSDADPVRLGVQGYRARMYEQRFGATPGEGVEKTARKVSHAYMQGLNWVLAYYVHGNTPVPVSSTHADAVAAAERQLQGKGRQSSAADSAEGLGASWDWYYPFHYAPLISDLAKFATGGKRSKVTVGGEVMSLDDDSWAPANGPVRPLVQLMAVLPPESARLCLPWKLAQILEGTRAVQVQGQSKGSAEQTSMASALADMFPSNLAPLIDMSGKIWAHTAIVKLPFADVKRLAIAAQQPDANEQELRPADEERNEIKAGTLVMHNSHPCATPLSLVTKQGLSWNTARSQLVSSKRQSWDAKPGKKSLSLLRLLVPDTDDSASMQLLSIREGLEQFVSMAGFDLAGVPVNPFSATLLPGCELPPAVVTERDWAKEQRKFAAPPGLAGRGRGRGGGYSTGGRGMAPGGRGSFAARVQGRGGGGSAVLTVPRRTVAVPIKNPDRPMWGQKASSATSGVPDWGDSPSWQPSSSANLDDEAVSQQLQEQFNREVGGGASSGFGLSLEDESLAVARMLQEEEERKVRKEYRPPDRRTAQQLKADEDFALRMQRQEQEIEKHQLAHFREAQRRQMTQFDMGGVPQQDQQAAVLPDAEFPGLSSASSEHDPEAPKWPIQRVRDKPQPLPSSGWDAPATSPHIPAVHRDNTDNYIGWGAEGGGTWGGDDEVGGKWAESAERGWGGDKTNGYHESADKESAGNDYTAAHSQGRGGRGSKVQDESGWGNEQPDRGWGEEQPDRSRNRGWGDEQPDEGWGDKGRGDEGASYGCAGRGATTEQAGGSWGDGTAAGGGWGPEQAGGSSRYEGSQASSGSRRGSASHVSQKEAAAASYMQSFAPPPASSIKERAAAASARIQQENAARQRREQLEMQQLEQNPRRSQHAPPPTYKSGSAPPVSTQQTYEYEPDPFQSDEPPRYDHAALYNQPPQYQQTSQYGQPVPHVQSVQPQSSAMNSAAPAYQPASAQPSKALQAQSTASTPAPAAESDIFDVDAWLLDMGVSPAPQKQAPAASSHPVSTVSSNQHLYDAAQHGSHNGSVGGSRPPSSGSDTSRVRYRPPHMRIDTESSTEVLSSSQPSSHGNGVAYSSGSGRKPPPGFSASTGY